MNCVFLCLSINLLGVSYANANFFGDFNRRDAAAVAGDLIAVSHLPTSAFDEIAPSVLDIARDARPSALKALALEVYISCSGDAAVGALMDHLNQCLDTAADALPRGQKASDRIWMINWFVTGDLAKWGAAIRRSAATVALLRRVVDYSSCYLDQSVYVFAVEDLMEILPDDAARRSCLLDLIGARVPGVGAYLSETRLQFDAASLQAVRNLAAAHPLNRVAIELLANEGDAASISIISSHRPAAVATGDKATAAFLDQAVRRINLLNPPTNLLAYIRSPDDDSFTHAWAIRTAVKRQLDRGEIRSAILAWAAPMGPLAPAGIKTLAQELGLLNARDMSNVTTASMNRIGCADLPKRHTGSIEVPDRRPKQSRWKPNEANWPQFTAWHRSQNWRGVTNEEILRQLKSKLCEFDLLSPNACASVPASQP